MSHLIEIYEKGEIETKLGNIYNMKYLKVYFFLLRMKYHTCFQIILIFF
jgi:hypothetical protein